jgi:CheY-like chemotaxis protein
VRVDAVSVTSGVAGGKVSILLVDDMEDNLLALEAALGGLRQNLVRANSGEAALKAVLRQEFAVILLDVLMPGMDGFDTAAHIKRLDQTRTVPIIFLTGIDSEGGQPVRGYAAGAVDYLTKPFDPWVLRAKVSVFVELYRKNCQLQEQAAQLRGLLGDEPGSRTAIGVLVSVSTRLAAVEKEMRRLAEAPGGCAEAGGLVTLAEEVSRMREQVDLLPRRD